MRSFRFLEEKSVSSDVTRMIWSPKMDLLALSNIQQEVVLHRLSWQCVWTIPVRKIQDEPILVTSLAWRPDGQVLAIGYSDGLLNVVDVENAEILHTTKLNSSLTHLCWQNFQSLYDKKKESNEISDYFVDTSSTYLSKLTPLPKSYSSATKAKIYSEENVEDSKKIQQQPNLNILVVTTKVHVNLFVFGLLHIVSLNVEEHISNIVCVRSAMLSSDLNIMNILVESKEPGDISDEPNTLHGLCVDSTLLSKKLTELRMLTKKVSYIVTLTEYSKATLDAMSEAWEDILLEMDTKLRRFKEEKGTEGTICDEFLQLLMWGTASADLENFLVNELTEKGLKKLGHSIETSYFNIQKLVLQHLTLSCRVLYYHLSDMKGMSKWLEKFSDLGVVTESVESCLKLVGSLMMKSNELLQIIESSMKNLKAFFRWLYVVILRLSDKTVPTEISKMTQKDLTFVADFIEEHFSEEGHISEGFRIERVGQYLSTCDLVLPVKNATDNPWVKMVQGSRVLKDSSLLIQPHIDKSLYQIYNMIHSAITETLIYITNKVTESMKCEGVDDLLKFAPITSGPMDYPIISQWPVEEASADDSDETAAAAADILSVFVLNPSADHIHIVKHTNRGQSADICVTVGALGAAGYVTDSNNTVCDMYSVISAQFYTQSTISMLIQPCTTDTTPTIGPTLLAQLSISNLTFTSPIPSNTDNGDRLGECSHFIQQHRQKPVDIGRDVSQFRELENMKVSPILAVSGSRKVSCVMYANCRRVRLFDMDAVDESDGESDDETQDEEQGGTSTEQIVDFDQ